MSLLAHIVGNDEPTATRALTYIMRSSSDIAQAFVQILDLPAFTPGRIVSELTHGDTRPDITVDDEDGATRAFVENKFWAGLTDQQPVAYLNALPEDATLLFIVPEQRIPTVWSELKKRCRDAGLDLTDESSRRVRIGTRSMSVASWNHVLGLLRNTAAAGGHHVIECDVQQLQGLTDRVDSYAFLPLRPDEITEVETAQRLINYSNLVESIADRLVENGIADRRDGIVTAVGCRPATAGTQRGVTCACTAGSDCGWASNSKSGVIRASHRCGGGSKTRTSMASGQCGRGLRNFSTMYRDTKVTNTSPSASKLGLRRMGSSTMQSTR